MNKTLNNDLDFLVKSLYSVNQSIKNLQENQEQLKTAIIKKMDMAGEKNHTVSESAENVQKAISVNLIENTKINYDIYKVMELCPEAVTKTLIVDSSNLEAFKALLKEFGLKGKQVNQLCKVMNLQYGVNAKLLDNKYNKNEITPEQAAQMMSIEITSRYLKFAK